jgi:hypothetical protein
MLTPSWSPFRPSTLLSAISGCMHSQTTSSIWPVGTEAFAACKGCNFSRRKPSPDPYTRSPAGSQSDQDEPVVTRRAITLGTLATGLPSAQLTNSCVMLVCQAGFRKSATCSLLMQTLQTAAPVDAGIMQWLVWVARSPHSNVNNAGTTRHSSAYQALLAAEDLRSGRLVHLRSVVLFGHLLLSWFGQVRYPDVITTRIRSSLQSET